MTQENIKEISSKDSTANQCNGDNFENCEEIVKEMDTVDMSNQSVDEDLVNFKKYEQLRTEDISDLGGIVNLENPLLQVQEKPFIRANSGM